MEPVYTRYGVSVSHQKEGRLIEIINHETLNKNSRDNLLEILENTGLLIAKSSVSVLSDSVEIYQAKPPKILTDSEPLYLLIARRNTALELRKGSPQSLATCSQFFINNGYTYEAIKLKGNKNE